MAYLTRGLFQAQAKHKRFF